MFPRRQVGQTPTRGSLISTLRYPTLHTHAHKIIYAMPPESDCKRCETTPIQPTTAFHLSLQPFRATTLELSSLGPHKNNSTLSLVH